jgi:serine/threonine protein kinase
MIPAEGQVIGQHYALVRLLDQGGMGAVWVARDLRSDAVVALKLLHYSLAHRVAFRRFRREALALERLNHPNVVRIVAHGVDASAPFIAMELLQGENLRCLIERRGALPSRQALDITRHAASGLGAAHALGIVHRDVKPSNLFLCDGAGAGTVKVVDFGIAIGELLETDSQSTGTGFIGSPAYMSPEQARAETVDRHADIWSLAVVAFQLLTGREPFAGANVPETLQRICSGQVPLPSLVASGLPLRLDEVFLRAFARKREHRFTDVSQFVDALDAAFAGVPDGAAISLPPVTRAGRTVATVSYVPGLAQLATPAWSGSRLLRGASLLVLALAGLLLTRPSASEFHALGSPWDEQTNASPAAPLQSASALGAEPPGDVPKLSVSSSAPLALDPPTAKRRAGGRAPGRALPSPVLPVASNSSAASAPPIAVRYDPVFGLRVSPPNAPEKPNPGDPAAHDVSRLDSASVR